MALVTTLVGRSIRGNQIYRHSDASAANTELVVSVPAGSGRRILQSTVVYSAAPTQAGVTFDIDSGVGAAYDATLNTGSANAQTSNYLPDGELHIGKDDAFKVTAPAGGGVITSQIVVYTEESGAR